MEEPNLPLTFYCDKENEDIQLLTTHDPVTIRMLLAYLKIEEEISAELAHLLTPESEVKYAVLLLRNQPNPGSVYAYTGILEYDTEGLKSGYVAVFKSKSGDLARIEKERDQIHEFLAETVQAQQAERLAAAV